MEAQKALRDAELMIDERLRPVGVERAHERDLAGEVAVADGEVELGPVLLLQARVGEAGAEVVVVDEPGRADVVGGLAGHGRGAAIDREAQRRAEVAVQADPQIGRQQHAQEALDRLLDASRASRAVAGVVRGGGAVEASSESLGACDSSSARRSGNCARAVDAALTARAATENTTAARIICRQGIEPWG